MARGIWRLLDPTHATAPEPCWRPSVDVYHGTDAWLLKFDLAGVLPSDIQLTMRGRRLTVAGVRRDTTIMAGRRAYSMEIAYSRFERSVELPFELESVEMATEYRDGMFMITIRAGESPT